MSVVKARVQQEARRAALQLSAAPAGERTAADPNHSWGATRGLNNAGPGLSGVREVRAEGQAQREARAR